MQEKWFARNIKAIREFNDLTQAQFGEKVGVSVTAVWSWENAGVVATRKNVLEKIRSVFNVTERDLFGYEDGFFAKVYGLEAITPVGSIKPAPSQRATRPLLGNVHAGTPTDPDLFDEVISLPFEVAERHPSAYFLKVDGDCMSRVYPNGCLILIDPTKEPQNGSIAVVSIDGADFIMRKLYRGANTLVLSPESFDPTFEDIVITAQDERTVEFVGTVVWFQPAEELC